MQTIIYILPELFLFLAISVLLLVGSSYSTSKRHGYPMLVKPIAWITIFALGLAFLLVINNPVPHQIIFSGALIVDNFTNFVKAVVLLSSIACLAVSLDYIKQERIHAFEYSILILFGFSIIIQPFIDLSSVVCWNVNEILFTEDKYSSRRLILFSFNSSARQLDINKYIIVHLNK